MADMINVKVFRFNPEADEEGSLVEYTLDKEPGMRILGALKALRTAWSSSRFLIDRWAWILLWIEAKNFRSKLISTCFPRK